MSDRYFIGLDLGGSGLRCLIVNANTLKSSEFCTHWHKGSIINFGEWGYNFDLDLIWKQLGVVVRQSIERINVESNQIIGIAATSMRLALVLVDKNGTVWHASPNIDARAVSQSAVLASERGEEFYLQTGRWPSPTALPAKLMWLNENFPDQIRAARSVLSLSDWVGYKLSGNLYSEISQAAESMLFDFEQRAWAFDRIQSLHLSSEIFPPLVEAGQQIGALTQEAADHLGLKPGTAVIAGGSDTQSGLLGLGAVNEGDIGVIAGTTTTIQMVTTKPYIDPKKRLWAGAHVVPGLYILESNAGSMGTTLDWFARNIYPKHPNPTAALSAEAAQADLGSGGIISTIGVNLFNASAMGLPIGSLIFSNVNQLVERNDRPKIARALLEGFAFSTKANMDQVLEVTGLPVETLSVGGGISRSQIFIDILSQVCRKPVQAKYEPNVSALGAAICAGVGTGVFNDLVSGSRALTSFNRSFVPEEQISKAYTTYYEEWLSLYHRRTEADVLAADMILEIMGEQTENVMSDQIEFRPKIYVDADLGEPALDALRQLGEVTYASYREGNVLFGEDMVEALSGYHVFITEVDIIDAEVLRSLSDLRLIIVCRGNPTNVDIDACTAAGIPVINTPGRNANAVADLTLALILMLARKMDGAIGFLHQPGGEAGDMGRMGVAYFKFCGVELWHKKIGIIGCGAVGKKVIQRLLPFEANILVYDPFLTEEQVLCLGAEKVELDTLLSQSDFISLHAQVTDDNHHLLDANAFAKMKKGVFLINTARAALVDDNALIDALRSGKLGGAALDVFSTEPPGSDDPLLAFENVIATPHIGGNTFEVGVHQGLIAAAELTRLLSGETPLHLINAVTLQSFSWISERQVKKEELAKRAAIHTPGEAEQGIEQQDETGEKKTLHSQKPPAHAKKEGFLKRLLAKKSPPERSISRDQSLSIAVGAGGSKQLDKFNRLLQKFSSFLMIDAELQEKSKTTNMVMKFVIRDIDQIFFIRLNQGEVNAGLGEPTGNADLTLRMAADIFDGLFTGRVNGNQAVMTGKMTFAGDTRKAMSMRRFFNIMNKSYQQALNEVGDLGDLSQIGFPAKTQSPGMINSAQASASAQPGKLGDVRDEIFQVMSDFFAKELITATGGNISARSENNPGEIWITPGSLYKGDLRADMMVKIDLNGNLVGENEYAASSERHLHCAIYRSRPEITSVIHSHAPQATLMAITGTPFLPISTEAAFIGEIPVLSFLMPGTQELGEKVAQAMGSNGTAVLMQNHGLVVAGSSLRRAADITEIIEVTAERLITCRLMGVEPPVLPAEILAELAEMGKLMV